MEEPLKPSAAAPAKTTGTLFFFGLHCLSYVAFAAIAVVAMVKGGTSDNFKMIFSIELKGRADFNAEDIDKSIYEVGKLLTLHQKIFPYHGMLMVPEKAITFIIVIWMAIASLGAMVILIMKAFSDSKVFSIAFGKWGKWTSVSFLLTCAQLLIPIFQEKDQKEMETGYSRHRNIANLLLSMCALIILVMAYGTSEKCTGSDYAFVYKKVCISTFFAFHLLNSIFSLVDLEFYKKSEELYKENDKGEPLPPDDGWERKFYRDQASNSWAMILLVGLSIAAISYLNADITMPIFICVFNLGYMILSTGIPTKSTELYHYNYYGLKQIKGGNIGSSVIMMVFLIAVAVLIYLFRKDKIKQ